LVTAEAPRAEPRCDNGEADLAKVLDRLGLEWTYEGICYSLGGAEFRPDFNLEPCRRRGWPALNLELTWADREWQGKNSQRAHEAINRKRWKIRQTREIHGIVTVLVQFSDWNRIKRNHQKLIELIDRAVASELAAA
jgi:hypothetical protein